MSKFEIYFMGFISVIGGTLAHAFGGWSEDLITLVIFMGIDFVVGVFIAGVLHKSSKTESGSLSSAACFKGLCKKCIMLSFVLIAHRLDIVFNVDYIRTAVIVGFLANELISIVENAGILGIPLPKVLLRAIDVLKSKSDEE